MTTTQTQADQVLQQIQQLIAPLDIEAKKFMQLTLADFYLKAADDEITTAEGAIALLNEVIPFVEEEMEVEADETDNEIFEKIRSYLQQEPDTLKAIRELESISDNLADEIEDY